MNTAHLLCSMFIELFTIITWVLQSSSYSTIWWIHSLINNTDKTLDVVFSILWWGFSFIITLRQRPKGVTRVPRWITRQRESMLRVTALGFCLRVIVNENPQNLEKKCSFCVVINLWMDSIVLLTCLIFLHKGMDLIELVIVNNGIQFLNF